MSGVRCHLSPVTFHMSLNPTTTATDPPPANSPTMHSRMLLLIKGEEAKTRPHETLTNANFKAP